MIHGGAIKPWTDAMLTLKEKIPTHGNDPLAMQLVDARFEMLKSQVGYYLLAETGQKGILDMVKENKTDKVIESVNCEDVPTIVKATRAYSLSFKYFINFQKSMDDLLQKSQEARELIGATKDNRVEFYSSKFGDVEKQITATLEAIHAQCGTKIELTTLNSDT